MTICSIHIIDDNETDRYLLKRLIKEASLTDTVFESENGSAALEFLVRQQEQGIEPPGGFPPRLIFLDINMPIMGGFEFLEEYSKLLERRVDLKPTILTMFTSSESELDKDKALSYDCVKGYIVKLPNSGDALREILRVHFPKL